MHRDRQAALQQRGCGLGSEHLLQLHGQHRSFVAVLQRHEAAGGHGQRRGQPPLQLLTPFPGQVSPECLDQVDPLQILAAAHCRQHRLQPGNRIGGQTRQAAIGPGGAQMLVRQRQSLLQLAAAGTPWQGLQAQAPQAFGQGLPQGGLLRSSVVACLPGAPLQHQGPEAAQLFAAQPLPFPIPEGPSFAPPLLPCQVLQQRAGQWCRQPHPGLASLAIEAGDRQRLLPRQRVLDG